MSITTQSIDDAKCEPKLQAFWSSILSTIELRLALLFVFSLSLSACFDFDAPVVSQVDVERYMGKWYQMAANETSFNRDLVAVTAEYTLKENGDVSVYNRGYKGSFDGELDEITGTAKVVDSSTNAKLNVTFPGIFNAPVPGGNYWIYVLDEVDYQYAAVADPIGVTLFILNRDPVIDEDLYQNILSELRSKGIDTSKLVRTPQPEVIEE